MASFFVLLLDTNKSYICAVQKYIKISLVRKGTEPYDVTH